MLVRAAPSINDTWASAMRGCPPCVLAYAEYWADLSRPAAEATPSPAGPPGRGRSCVGP